MRALAQSLKRGLRPVRSPPDLNRWMSCHALDREGREPSAPFHFADGVDQDCKDVRTLSFFDIDVELGAFDTSQESRDWCGDRLISRHVTEKLILHLLGTRWISPIGARRMQTQISDPDEERRPRRESSG